MTADQFLMFGSEALEPPGGPIDGHLLQPSRALQPKVDLFEKGSIGNPSREEIRGVLFRWNVFVTGLQTKFFC